MRRLEFSPAAEADLLDIADYIAADHPPSARSFAAALEVHCTKLADFPGIGRQRPELAPELRSVPHGRYVIYYTPSEQAVRIERILHGARDVEAEFEGEGGEP